MKNIYKIKSKVWRWPGDAGWHFISLDKKISQEIKKNHGANFYGSGFLKIRATLGNSIWQTALFPHTAQGIYLLSIKKNIRKKEDVIQGDIIDISFEFI